MTIIIKNWSKHYEKSDHKKCKEMKWVAVPIKFDGKGYKRLMKMKDGLEIFGAWIVLLQLAAKQPERGKLADNDGDLTLEDMELITECPAKTLEKAISVLSSENFRWIEETCGKFPKVSGNPPTTLQDITGHNKTIFNTPSEDIKPKPKPKQKRKHSFEESPLFDKKEFAKRFPDWYKEKLAYWYERALTYSGANGGKYLDWGLAILSWERNKPFISKDAKKLDYWKPPVIEDPASPEDFKNLGKIITGISKDKAIETKIGTPKTI